MSVVTTIALGGRWTSMVLGGREWLWSRADLGRASVAPGDPFIDVGGLEECIPTIRGIPDHGEAWSRRWLSLDASTTYVQCPDFVLQRRILATDETAVATYMLSADPGYRFVWAAHALLDLSTSATLSLPNGTPMRVYPGPGASIEAQPSEGASWVHASWPECAGIPFERLGAIDGSAHGAIAVGADGATIADQDQRLTLELHADSELPRSVAIWRNLGGFPSSSPYRSIGVEPMLGSVFDLAEADRPEDAVTVPVGGSVEWELVVRAV